MASRWMQQVAARNRSYRRRRGNESLTDRERKHSKQRIILLPSGGILVETIEKFILRLREEAAIEQINPSEWWRRLARVIKVVPGPISIEEWNMVKRSAQTAIWEKGKCVKPAEPVQHLIDRILKWRKTHPVKPPKTKEQLAIERRARGRIPPTKQVGKLVFPKIIID